MQHALHGLHRCGGFNDHAGQKQTGHLASDRKPALDSVVTVEGIGPRDVLLALAILGWMSGLAV